MSENTGNKRTKLEKVMFEKGVKMKDVEEGSQVSHSTLHELKKGIRKNPEYGTLKRIADFLQVSVSEIDDSVK